MNQYLGQILKFEFQRWVALLVLGMPSKLRREKPIYLGQVRPMLKFNFLK